MSMWLPSKDRDRGGTHQGPRRDGGGDGADAAAARGQWSPQRLEGQEGPSPGAPGGSVAPSASYWTSGFQNCKKEFLSS